MREDGFSDADVQEAKAAARGRILYDLGTVDGASSRLATWDSLNPILTPEMYLSRVDGISAEALQRVQSRYLNPRDYAIVSIGADVTPADPTPTEEDK